MICKQHGTCTCERNANTKQEWPDICLMYSSKPLPPTPMLKQQRMESWEPPPLLQCCKQQCMAQTFFQTLPHPLLQCCKCPAHFASGSPPAKSPKDVLSNIEGARVYSNPKFSNEFRQSTLKGPGATVTQYFQVSFGET